MQSFFSTRGGHFMTIALVSLLILVVIGGSIVGYLIHRIKNAAKTVIFGLDLLKTGLEQQENEIEMTPKSVNGMTALCIPRVTKDFPEFNWHEFKQKSENMLKSALFAITKENAALITDASDDLRTQISLVISGNREQHIKETYQNITIHQTEIADYRKMAGTCIITLQTAAGSLHYQKKDGTLIEGSDTALRQTRFNIELLYIQDADKIEGKGNALSITCPSCGAPVTGVGQKICSYCGCAITEINIRAWALNRYYEV